MNIFHDAEGLVFEKHQADTGISYLAVPLDNVMNGPFDGLLVRHGDAGTGECGYYPLSLILSSPFVRAKIAQSKQKRPPNERWVRKILERIEESVQSVVH